MVQFWRAAGLTYVRYVNVCSRVLRSCLKDTAKKQAASRELENMKFRQWSKGTKGKLGAQLFERQLIILKLIFFFFLTFDHLIFSHK